MFTNILIEILAALNANCLLNLLKGYRPGAIEGTFQNQV
jgi:hypothetical protein